MCLIKKYRVKESMLTELKLLLKKEAKLFL